MKLHLTQEKPPPGLVIHAIDRATIWIDVPEFPIAEERLKKHCTDLAVHLEQMPYQARWKLRIEVFQPTIRFLELLVKACGKNISTQFTYLEIAMDIPADSKKQAQGWRNSFLAAACMRYQRQLVVREKNCWYFGRRTDDKKRRNSVLAIYADRPSKLNNAQPYVDAPTCFHIEWRAIGSLAISDLGVVSIDDLIRFNHQKFWSDHLKLYQLPKPTTLGQLLAKLHAAKTDVSGSALRKRAQRWREKHSIKNKFVMHNALVDARPLEPLLRKISLLNWLKTCDISKKL